MHVPSQSVGVQCFRILWMDLAGNFRGKCPKHGAKCIEYKRSKPESHNCLCGCPAFEHVSCIHLNLNLARSTVIFMHLVGINRSTSFEHDTCLYIYTILYAV